MEKRDFNENEPFTVSISSNGNTYTAELPWDSSVEDILDAFTGMLVSATFPYPSILRSMQTFAEEHLDAYYPQIDEDSNLFDEE